MESHWCCALKIGGFSLEGALKIGGFSLEVCIKDYWIFTGGMLLRHNNSRKYRHGGMNEE
jgi:hypothetical protein